MKKTSNKKEIKFTNELLAIWAQSCEKRRDLKEIDDNIKKLEEDNINRQENIKNNPSLKDSENESIKMNSDKITSKKTEIANLQKEILNLEKEAKDKLNKIKIDLSQSKKKIDLYRTEKTAAAAKTSE